MNSRVLLATALAAVLIWAAETGPGEKYTAVERRHWAFQPVTKPELPVFTLAAEKVWAKHPIDAFVLAKLKKEGLKPSPAADRSTWLRRVTLDLTGLPPAPEQLAAFVNDSSPTAHEKVVDRLLASPSYGERWAQHWLDVVRFGESDGFEYDTHRSDAFRYRDYVAASLQQDKPYDKFITEQLAGDEIDPNNHELRIASGFQRLGSLRKNAGNQEVASSRNEVLTEMTNIVGAAFLGVTLGCARCHDHKFDPIRHKDYYRMQAFFAPVHDSNVVVATDEEKAAWESQKKVVEDEIKDLRRQMKGLKGEERERMQQLVRNAEERMPAPPPSLYSVQNDFDKVTPVHVLSRGDYQNKGERVGMRALGVFLPDGAPELPADTKTPRLELARWVANPSNPLTARVMANRIWQHHFGRGIVPTSNDFGRMGGRPSHPQLLDWLADSFVANGWRMKPLHRMIVLSNTYRQASRSPMETAAMGKDPDNAWLWRHSRRRMDAEQLRDSMLAISGQLNLKAGGPSVIVPVDGELVNLLYKPSQWAVTKDASEHNRRSLYLMHKRNLRVPMMEAFDAPDFQTSCARREESTHAPQALELLNGALANRLAQSLAARLDRETKTPAAQVDRAYRLAAGREPTAKEKQLGIDFLRKQSLREFSLAIMNLNAFLYIN
ncbi:MAG: DUF1553 domain-containing protein [Acidobacteriia bacterium]|nr:DUF1553 domain-containing protein [Terriglobia bacterium]